MTDERTFCLPGSVPLPLVAVPAGSFSMGSPAGETGHEPEETAHRVTLTRGFYLGRAPVTRRRWAALMEGKAPAAAEADEPDPLGPPSGEKRILRGGCFKCAPPYCRAANRYAAPPDRQAPNFGFRVGWSPEKKGSQLNDDKENT